ncbi:MAG: tRNA lysidine(34) synthetase TilS [Capnocytophaga sp.]|nr:tRNA lysidine(34) synthetase TilS [Capnocytophaga sp.]
MISRFKKHFAAHFSDIQDKKILLAISGGIDSVVLAILLKQINVSLHLAHCNFQLRGEESDGDELFVKDFANKQALPLYFTRFETKKYAKEHKLNTQLAARQLRYQWFAEVCKEKQCDYIAVAHHADDMVETFLINLSRGSGLQGLLSIPERNGNIIRPLLPFSRDEICHFAIENNIKWREDSSNATDHYVRNKIRHHISPILKEIHSHFLQNFLRTQENLAQTQSFLHSVLENIAKECFIYEDKTIFLVEKIKNNPHRRYILLELFKKYNFKNADELDKFVSAPSGKQIYSDTHRIIQHHGKWEVVPLHSEKENFIFLIEENISQIENPFRMHITEVEKVENFNPNVIYINKDKVTFPLQLRKRKEADYFYPIGMKYQKKLLSKFFKDEKYSIIDKENQWILTDNEDSIIWIIKKRLDERYKVTENTKNILKIEIL